MYKNYCKLRDSKGIKDADVARSTGITKSTFSDWKNGRSVPKNEKLQKIADYFQVPLEYLLGKEGLVRCPICGLEYLSSNLEDCKIHEIEHRNFQNAIKKFGLIYSSYLIEDIKNEHLNIAADYSNSFEARINSWIEVFRAYWSRSLSGCSYNIEHPCFDEYASMLLNQPKFKARINDDLVYNRLVCMYGTCNGIDDGTTYYKINKTKPKLANKDKQFTTLAAHFDGDEYTKDELDEIKKFAEFVKQRRGKD